MLYRSSEFWENIVRDNAGCYKNDLFSEIDVQLRYRKNINVGLSFYPAYQDVKNMIEAHFIIKNVIYFNS